MVPERNDRGRNAGADLYFLSEDSLTVRTRFVSIVVESELGHYSCVAYIRGPQNRRFTKRCPKSNRLAKKGQRRKNLGTSDLGLKEISVVSCAISFV